MDEVSRAGTDPGQALSALEKALRDALAAVPLEQVLQRVTVMFPKAPVDIDTGPASRFHGRVQKVSVSMPEELTAAVRARTGPGEFSRYVTEATERKLQHDVLGEVLDELDAEFGPVPPELLEWAERQWPDYEAE
ncbi:hypothetical protein [Trebonia sp.]|uniref:hypothetical protein n=1 Tax=Trebonia sp. TaxID=2767075 RepID=UPI002637F260|nr:hypothetical protein [Trebonia sp.]